MHLHISETNITRKPFVIAKITDDLSSLGIFVDIPIVNNIPSQCITPDAYKLLKMLAQAIFPVNIIFVMCFNVCIVNRSNKNIKIKLLEKLKL